MSHRSFFLTLALAALVSSVNAPEAAAAGEPKPNQFWWPDQLNLHSLRDHGVASNPLGDSFNYADAFNSLTLSEVKADIAAVLTDSQDWWPADYGTYAPFFIRLAWHAAGTYRTLDGRGGAGGGQQRGNVCFHFGQR